MNIRPLELRNCLNKTSFQLGFCFLLFPVLFGSVIIFPNTALAAGLSSSVQVLIGIVLLILSLKESPKNSSYCTASAATAITFFYLISDVTIRNNGFLGDYFPFIVYTVIFGISYALGEKIRSILPSLIALTSISTGIACLWKHTGDKLLFTDDHPSFLYRLTQLKEHFPNIPFYNPDWNAGVEAREFFASGILNVYFIFSPLIHLFEVQSIYNIIVISILFILLPISIFWCGKNLNLSSTAISIAICLALSHSIFWYRWALSYGTLAFIVSMSLIPLNLSFIGKLVDENIKISRSQLIIMALSVSLMLLWSLSGVLLFPVALLALYFLKDSINKYNSALLFIILLAINLPWINIFYQASQVGSFISGSTNSTTSAHESSKFKDDSREAKDDTLPLRTFNSIRKQALPINPLILFFGIPGLFFFAKNRLKFLLIAFCFSASILGIIISLLKPHLELDRMILALSLVLSLPAATFISDIIKHKQYRFISACIVSFLFFIPLWIHKISSNYSSEKYSVETPIVRELASKIEANHMGGRTLFSGFSLHELDGGHLAPLPIWTKSPLIASSYQHDKWKYTDVIPKEYRSRKTEGILEYLKLMNVSLVVSNDRFWRKWFLARPSKFERIATSGVFTIFKVKSFQPNFFYEGTGQIIDQSGGQIKLKFEGDSVIIKFNYLPFLMSKNCTLSPYEVSPGINFIKISNCSQNNEVVITSGGALERFF